MSRVSLLVAVLPLSMLAVSACASTGEVDELAGESTTDDASTGKADAAADGSYTYYSVRRDMRRCASPMCGGYFVERVNRTTTTCVDGSASASCYAPELDWSESGLGEGQQDKLVGMATKAAADGNVWGLVRGRFAKTNAGPRPELGRFVVTEAWVAEGGNPAIGVFARIKDAGVRCIAAPCPSLKERGLNTSRFAMIAGVDYAEANLSDHQLEGFGAALFDSSGIIVAGDRYTIHESGRSAKGRTATNAFHRLVEPVAAPACYVGGCSSQICSDVENVITTCEWNAQYACYATATCERQPSGACGWTPTQELTSCLATP